LKPSNTPPKPLNSKKPKRPLTPYQVAAQKPMRTRKRFNPAHRLRDKELWAYIAKQDKKIVQVSPEVQKQLGPEAAKYLFANNAYARINFVRIARKHIKKLVKGKGENAPFYFVTLTPVQYALAYSEAQTFDLRQLQSWTWSRMGKLNFIGMVEAAHYRNRGLVQGRNETTVSWHVHLVVWGIGEADLAKRLTIINARGKALIPGAVPAHYRRLEPDEVTKVTTYMLKAPMKEHSTYPTHRMMKSPKTGETEKVPTGRWETKKEPYDRRGIAMMTNVMANCYLDKLLFAGGGGKALAKAINAEALKPLERHERQREPRVTVKSVRKPRK
jgi:hypothetical protein